MSSKLTELEKKLGQLLDSHMPKDEELVEISFELGREVGLAGLSKYEFKPLKLYKEKIARSAAEYQKIKAINNLFEKLVLFSFKAFFMSKDETFEIVENGRAVPCDNFGDEIAEKIGVEVIGARVNKDWDNEFEISLEARGWLKDLMSRFKVPVQFRCHFGNADETYYRTIFDIDDAAYGLNSVDVSTRNLMEMNDNEIDEFMDELKKMVTFFSLAYPLPTRD